MNIFKQKTALTCLLSALSILSLSEAAHSESSFYNGHDLAQLCAGFESGFKMADFRSFKCEAYLMGYIDRIKQTGNENIVDLADCLRDSSSVAVLAKELLVYLKETPSDLDKPAPDVINHVMAKRTQCE